jgi:hypothetical protein
VPVAARTILIVLTSPAAGQDDEFNSWYEQVHIPELFEHIPELRSATRYRRIQGSPSASDHLYCNVFEIDSGEPGQVLARISSVAASGLFRLSDSLATGANSVVWEQVMPTIERDSETVRTVVP